MYTNATTHQIGAFFSRMKVLCQTLTGPAQGVRRVPMEPGLRIQAVNQTNDLIQTMDALDLIDHELPLGPNDIVVDKTAPVPIRDTASGVSGTGVVSVVDGNPVVDLTASKTIALMENSQQLPCTANGQIVGDGHQGNLVIDDGVPKRFQLGSNRQIVDISLPFVIANKNGSDNTNGVAQLGSSGGPNQGKVVALLPSTSAIATHDRGTTIYGSDMALHTTNCKLRVAATGVLSGVVLSGSIATVGNDSVREIGGVKYKFTVADSKITKIDIVQ